MSAMPILFIKQGVSHPQGQLGLSQELGEEIRIEELKEGEEISRKRESSKEKREGDWRKCRERNENIQLPFDHMTFHPLQLWLIQPHNIAHAPMCCYNSDYNCLQPKQIFITEKGKEITKYGNACKLNTIIFPILSLVILEVMTIPPFLRKFLSLRSSTIGHYSYLIPAFSICFIPLSFFLLVSLFVFILRF